MKDYLKTAIDDQKLPDDFGTIVEERYVPIANDVAERSRSCDGVFILGVQGSQGSGKSTLASFVQLLLENEFGLEVAVLSLDDFYLTRRERIELSERVDPLFKTRGVPGTHDVALAKDTIESLKTLTKGERLAIPRFDKSIDDRAEGSEWDEVEGPIDVIIFEGWCVGVAAQAEEALAEPANEFERIEDASGSWRNYVNEQLENSYAKLFGALDALLVLQAPSFEIVFEWRSLQEEKLAAKVASAPSGSQLRIQTPDELRRFISHYERLTRQCIAQLPSKADWVLYLDKDHKMVDG